MYTDLFIHKFQPSRLSEFEMEDALFTSSLRLLVDSDNINILLAGNMGSGKSSLLNALISEYYSINEKDGIGLNNVDNDNVLYINSLKEQGINYFRNDVKTFCQTTCSKKHKKKMIVLDDIDLMNEQSQQVFRNYMDKFNHNVHFIASCSNIQKVIESLQSRLLIVNIQPPHRESLYKIMKKIQSVENIKMDESAERFILNVCNNTFKTLINYMEKFKLLGEKITYELANEVCTNISFTVLSNYTSSVKSGNLHDAIRTMYSVYDKGYSGTDILDNYFLFVKSTDSLSDEEKYDIIPIICKYISIFHTIHEDEIELALFTNSLYACWNDVR